MVYTLSPWLPQQFFDANGDPLAAGKVFFYQAGTSTKLDTWSDAGGTAVNANPVVLDSSGQADIFFGPYTYDVLICTSTANDPPSGAQIITTKSGVAATTPFTGDTDIQGTAGETGSVGEWYYLSQGDGGLTAGRWYKTDQDFTYRDTTLKAAGVAMTTPTAGAEFTLRISGRYTEAVGLTAGTVYYFSATAGALTTVGTRAACIADSTTSYVISYRLRDAAAQTSEGIVILGDQQLGTGVKSFAQTPYFYPGGSNGGAYVSGVLSVQTTPVGNVLGGEDNLMTYTLFSGTLDSQNTGIRITAWGSTAANANNKTIKLYFGSTVLVTSATAAFNNQAWRIVADVYRYTSASAQVANAVFTPDAPAAGLNIVVTNSTPAENVASSSPVIKCTGTSAAAATDDIRQLGMIVEAMNAI